ncbi:allophanate hydrolase [Devosia sp.]|uniref:allophanate hydrolase n=1 Tax=Devosia sp. TaxID=1871048 RepID=UPI002FC5A4BA
MSSPVESVRSAYAALAAYADPALFISLKPEAEALKEAAALEAAGPVGKPLYGLTLGVKDNIHVAGLPTTAACPAFTHVPGRSAAVVQKLEAAGAIVIGKTNLDQFATGLVGVRSPYGVPRNALRSDLIPGGSSSGSAVAVAAGIVDFALGTDTAGSGRVPAGMNGIVGLKPTLGLLSSTGMVPACRTLDTISVFARDVETARKVTEIAAGYDAADAYSRVLPTPAVSGLPPRFRVGVPPSAQRLFFGDAAAEAAYAADLERLAALGGQIVEIDFEPLHAVARLLYEGPWVAERYAATKPLIETQPEALHPVTLKIIGGANGLTAVSAFEAAYKLAEYRRAATTLLSGIDILAVPTVPRFYTLAELDAEPITHNSNLGAYTNFVNLLDMAAISVPVGRRSDGLPSSLTLIGRSGSDGYLAGIATGLEGSSGATPLRAAPGQIELAVVGAHLSGLPLNKELVALGASFLRSVETVPDYALYALPNTVPPKPGLLRGSSGSGASIAAEVWGLDAAGFGQFVAAIPSPLGIGTLRFTDGTEAKGFLVEAEAVKGAEDVSAYGGWRAYVTAPKSAMG